MCLCLPEQWKTFASPAQLGLTFCDPEGRLPVHDNYFCVWQFNFREFSLGDDMYAQVSVPNGLSTKLPGRQAVA